ncbi:MAG: nuclear transport factor 2 family protein [Thermoleophilia bacterium]
MNTAMTPREFIAQWGEAIVANDVPRMESFVVPEWVVVDRPGIITREAFHAAVDSGRLRHDAMRHEVIEVRELNADVVVLITRCRSRAVFQNDVLDADEWTTDVLLRTGGRWRCVTTQLTPRERGT